MPDRNAMLTVLAVLALIAHPGCRDKERKVPTKVAATAPTTVPEATGDAFLHMVLTHFEPDGVSFQDLVIASDLRDNRSDPYIEVQITREQAKAVIAALDECKAWQRQDYPPPGVPRAGWTLSVRAIRGEGPTVQGTWYLGREKDINLPGQKRDILRAAVNALAGNARRRVDAYLAGVAGKAPEMDFKLKSHWSEGRVFIAVIGEDARLAVWWRLPDEIAGPLQAEIAPGKDGLSVVLYRGNVYPPARQWGGAHPAPPLPGETAMSGVMTCAPAKPGAGPGKTVTISLRNLRFPTLQIDEIGPIQVRLDVIPMP